MKTWIAKLGLTALTAATLILPGATTFAGSSTLYVDDDKKQCASATFTTVQAAVDAAKPGDTVYVCPGTYTEKVTINKKLTLRGKEIKGQQLPLITASGGAAEAVVTAFATQDVSIRDLRIEGAAGITGILAQLSTHVTVQDVTVKNAGTGIAFDRSNKGEVRDSTLTDNSIGINVDSSLQVKIKHNTLQTATQNTNGITLFRADKAEISDNKITNVGIGIFVVDTFSAQVTSNTVTTPQEVGIRLDTVTKSTVRKNTVTGSKNNGIGVAQSDGSSKDNTIEENTIKNSANLDAHDVSVGTKTAGTANTWKDNTCVTSDPKGLCKK